MAKFRIDDGKNGDASIPTRFPSSCGRKNTAKPIAATAAWFEMTTEAASTTAIMNVTDAATPTVASTNASP